MSGFFGSNDSTKSRWGGYLKQAISNVETTFDSLLVEQPNGASPATTTSNTTNKDVETYVDPISGMVTTIERTQSTNPTLAKEEEPKVKESRSSSDLSTRLAAVMAEKSKAASVTSSSSLKESVHSKKKEDAVIEPEKVEENEATTTTEEVIEDPLTITTDITPTVDKLTESTIPEDNADKKKPGKQGKKSKKKKQALEAKEETETAETEKAIDDDTIHNKDKIEPLPAATVDTKNDDKDRILAQRETQLFQAMETIAKLHDQIHQLQEDAEKNESELKSQIQQLETSEGSSKGTKKLETTIEELRKQIGSQEEKIQGLMQEGEKLSKVELKYSTMIKKLRLEKTESEKSTAELTKKLEKLTQDLSQASEKGTKQSEIEKRLQESVKLLSDLSEQQTKHINKLESEKIINAKKHSETEAALQKALESIESEKIKAKTEAEQVNAAALEKEIKANDRLHKELTKLKLNTESTENKLRKELRELQIALQTVEEQAGVREDKLRKEVAELQTQVSYQTMDDMSLDEATAPLLRQIEQLQTQHALAIKTRDQAEQSTILRMQTAEAERKKALEKDEKLQSEIQSLNQHLSESEQQMAQLNLQVTTLEAQADADSVAKRELEERIQSLIQEKQQLTEKEVTAQEGLKAQYQHLMKEKLNEEKKQFEMRLKAAERQAAAAAIAIEETPIMTSPPSVSSRSSFDSNSTTPVTSTILVERLQANIRQLENQLSFYQTQLQSSSQSRDELSEEVLQMSQEMETLRASCKKANDLQKQHDQLHGRYQTLLELLGERTEEVEELKADLADVKEMYKSQILELVQTIDQLKK